MKKKFSNDQDIEVKNLYSDGMSARAIARKYSVYPQVVYNSLRRSGVIIDNKRRDPVTGSNHPRWRGGRRKVKGYEHFYDPSHNLARSDGWVPEHRHVMQKKIGRELKKDEVVHHIDEDKENNDPENLMLYKNNAEHMSHHNKTFRRDLLGKYVENY